MSRILGTYQKTRAFKKQVNSKLTTLVISIISGNYICFIIQKSKLAYAQNGMYDIYLGAVFGSRGFINSASTARLINLDALAAAVLANPNLARKLELVAFS